VLPANVQDKRLELTHCLYLHNRKFSAHLRIHSLDTYDAFIIRMLGTVNYWIDSSMHVCYEFRNLQILEPTNISRTCFRNLGIPNKTITTIVFADTGIFMHFVDNRVDSSYYYVKIIQSMPDFIYFMFNGNMAYVSSSSVKNTNVLNKLFHSSENCVNIDFTFLGIAIGKQNSNGKK
jgi:hypothetical protein